MKQFFKIIIFKIADKIAKYSEQYRSEKIYSKYNFDKTIRIYNVSLEGDISIGRYTYVNERSRIDSGPSSKVSIGKHCAIGRNVHISSKTHDISQPTTLDNQLSIPILEKDINIGNSVWIGNNVTILPGVQIDNYAIIGANSLVNKNIKEFEIVGGVPAKHIRFNTNHCLYRVK